MTIWGTRLSFKNDHNIRATILQYCYCKKRDVSTEESISQLSSDTGQARYFSGVNTRLNYIASEKSYVLGSSSIWTWRILNICCDFFHCASLKKQQQIFKIWHVQIDELPRKLVFPQGIMHKWCPILGGEGGLKKPDCIR